MILYFDTNYNHSSFVSVIMFAYIPKCSLKGKSKLVYYRTIKGIARACCAQQNIVFLSPATSRFL